MRFLQWVTLLFQPLMLVGAVGMAFIGALGIPGCARAISECLNEAREVA